MTIRALVLAGGGVRGAFQVGMVRELVRHYDFQIIRGVSVGALNGAFLAQAPVDDDPRAALDKQAASLEAVWGAIGAAMGAVGDSGGDRLARMKELGEKLHEVIGKTIAADRLSDLPRDFTAGYVSLSKGTYAEAVSADADVRKLVQASAALPPHFPFVDMEDDLVVDGGFRNITPLASALKAEPPPDEVYVLLTRQISDRDGKLLSCTIETQPVEEWRSLAAGDLQALYQRVSERLVEILMDEVYIEDIKRAIQVNLLARALARSASATKASSGVPTAGTGPARPLRYVKLYVLAPRRRFNPRAPVGQQDAIDAFDTGLIDEAIKHGACIAANPELWAWRPEMESRFGDAL